MSIHLWVAFVSTQVSRVALFEVALPSGETLAPAVAGQLIDNTGFGLQVVDTVVDVDNFTIDIYAGYSTFI